MTAAAPNIDVATIVDTVRQPLLLEIKAAVARVITFEVLGHGNPIDLCGFEAVERAEA
jgi:hypothetical protein